MSRMPFFYIPPLMTPFYWADEQTGALPAAVRAYFNETVGQGSMAPDQLALVIEFAVYFIDAPCWFEGAGEPGDLERLRTEAKTLKTVEDVRRWTRNCMELGIDPW